MSAARVASQRTTWLVSALVALATLFMLQGSRVFVGYLVFVVDQSQRVTLALAAIVVFTAPALAWILVRMSRARGVLVGSVSLLVVVRLVLQFWEHPTARVLLGAAIIVTWGWMAVVTLDRARAATGTGLILGLAADVVMRMASGAIDLPWMPGIGAHLATILLGLTLLLVVRRAQTDTEFGVSGSAGATLPLVAIGSALALHHLVTGNLALAHVAAGGERAVSWSALLAGLALGVASLVALGQTTSGYGRGGARVAIGVTIVLGGIGLWLFWAGGNLALVGIVLAPAGAIVLLGAALAGGTVKPTEDRSGRIAAVFTLGLALQVALLFIYYTYTGLAAVLPVAWIIIAASALRSGHFPSIPRLPTTRENWFVVATVVVAFMLAIVPELASTDPQAVEPPEGEFTLMVYNIQSGFALDRSWSLRDTAQAIQDENPDIVVLNEVSRGWLVTSGNDELPWLSRELGMPYVWGPASDDGLWGNAILSRFPMSDSSVRKFTSTQNLKRSATGVRVEIGVQGVWVFGTHLDNPRGAGAARMEQVTELIEFWDNRDPAIVAGDFNAASEDDVMHAMAEAGFNDPGVLLGVDSATSQDHRRIDYILTTSGIEVLDIWIPDTEASDHKPVVARLRMGR